MRLFRTPLRLPHLQNTRLFLRPDTPTCTRLLHTKSSYRGSHLPLPTPTSNYRRALRTMCICILLHRARQERKTCFRTPATYREIACRLAASDPARTLFRAYLVKVSVAPSVFAKRQFLHTLTVFFKIRPGSSRQDSSFPRRIGTLLCLSASQCLSLFFCFLPTCLYLVHPPRIALCTRRCTPAMPPAVSFLFYPVVGCILLLAAAPLSAAAPLCVAAVTFALLHHL